MNKVKTWMYLLKQINVTGAVAFSSTHLAKQMLDRVNFDNTKTIIELGAGSGCITKEIARKKRPECKLLIFEVNEVFCEILRERIQGENIFIINDSAENMEYHLEKITGKAKVDCIISSLPFTIFNQRMRENIFRSILKILNPWSYYVQFGYNKRKYKQLLNNFQTVNTSFVLGNLPPAYVFNCRLHQTNLQTV